VLRGSVIGDGATIAPGSVVNGRIPAGACASGVPARVTNASTSAGGEHDTNVAPVVASVFGLPAPPDAHLGPDEIEEWDSLGSLKLLLALEEAFGFSIDEDVDSAARTVGEVQQAVDSMRQRAAAHA